MLMVGTGAYFGVHYVGDAAASDPPGIDEIPDALEEEATLTAQNGLDPGLG